MDAADGVAQAVDGRYDAIVLAGGAARRLGGVDKPALEIAGVPLIERVLSAVSEAGRIVVVGPRRPLRTVTRDVTWRVEDPPGAGPVAAVAAGLGATSAPVVVLLAADLPWIAPAVPQLVGAVPGRGAALLTGADGRVNHLAAAWRRFVLVETLAALPVHVGAAMRELTAGRPLELVADRGHWGDDCDTWDEVALARARSLADPPG